MGTLLNSESRRLYSWWWDSHVSPKNSKWLQDNLTDMDGKVKVMIKLIEEDADSFAKRAEMYYKKRPELMKLVEEFYRAYRALAERYNHATGELRQAHRTMAQAFPDLVLGDETPSNSDPDTPKTPHAICAFFDSDQFQGLSGSNSPAAKRFGAFSDESEKGVAKKGLKQVNDMSFSDGKAKERNLEGDVDELLKDNEKLKGRVMSESKRASKAESELRAFREALAKIESEKEAVLVLYQQSLEKLTTLEKSLDEAEADSRVVNEQACKAKTEIQTLQAALRKLEAERDVSLLNCRQSLEKLAVAEEDVKRLSERAMKEENECKHLNRELDKLKSEKEVSELHYWELLDKVAELEKKLALASEKSKVIDERCEKAEKEVQMLKDEVRKLTEERDTMALQYKLCLETISKLRNELNEVVADNDRLNSEILSGSVKLKGAEDRCVLLGKLNESLHLEAQNLSRKIALADEELSRKESELGRLTESLKEEKSRFSKAETTLENLQKLHFQSQEEQRALALEVRNGVQMMKDLEICKRDLQVEVRQLKDENQTLNDMNFSSSISQKKLEDEVLNMREMKEKLEAEVKRQAEQSDGLQLQVRVLNEEIESLYKRYRALMQEMESLGLNPESFGSSVRALRDENQRLKEASAKEKDDREVLMAKLQEMEQVLKRNVTLESALFEVNTKLERSKEKAEALQGYFGNLKEEKSTLVTERAALLSQLQIITETMQSLLERNATLQTSLCGATAELEGLRAKSKGLEELCELLSSEKSYLSAERSNLASRLEIVEKKLEYLDMRFTNLEDKYAGLEKEKQATINQVEELRVSIDIEKQQRTSLVLTSEARLSGLEGHIHDLQEENKYRKVEFEEQLEKAVNAQVEIFILQKFVKDMEEKNFSLLIECQRRVEEAKYSEELITELESENMIQQVEAEILLDEIERLKDGIHRVLKALEIKHDGEKEKDCDFIPHALAKIRNIESSLLESKDENQRLLIEKSLMLSILRELYLDCEELSSKKTALEKESVLLTEQLVKLEDEKQNVLERSRELNLRLVEGEKREEALKVEARNLLENQVELQGSYLSLKEENLEAYEQKKCQQQELQRIKEEKTNFEEENSAILVDMISFGYLSMVLRSYVEEKVAELGKVSEDLKTLSEAYGDLENEARRLEEKLVVTEIENVALMSSMEELKVKQLELSAGNDQLRKEISGERELLVLKEEKVSELERKLDSERDLRAELCATVRCLEKEHGDLEVRRAVLEKQIFDLSEHSKCQGKEIVCLREANGSLESEIGELQVELEEHKIREVILTSELHEKSGEFELWEAEAASFYFDLQISSVREALFENKVYELGSLCEDLEDVRRRRSMEIEKMKMRVSALEREAGAVKSQVTGTSNQTKEKLLPSSVLLELQKLQNRVLEIQNIMVKQKAATDDRANASARLRDTLNEIEELTAKINNNNEEENHHSPRHSMSSDMETQVGTQMKDIPLDQASGRSFHGSSHRGSDVSEEQMLELWEEAEHDFARDRLIFDLKEQRMSPTEGEIVNQNGGGPSPEPHFEKDLGVDTLRVSTNGSVPIKNKRNTQERLASDAQKLSSLLASVHELKRKTEPNKRRKKTEDAEIGTFRGRLQEMESSVVRLMDMNTELMKTSEENSRTMTVSEEVSREAEKIGRLELEIQSMQYAFLRMMDVNKNKGKGSVSRSSTAVLLREFFYSRERKSKKPKKSRFCGCLRPSATKT